MTTQTKLITADELLMMPEDGYRYELIRGVLIRKMPPGRRHGNVAACTTAEFINYVRTNDYGEVSAEIGYRLESDPDTVRAPNVVYISAETLPLDVKVRGFYEVIPDLVVEVVSPGDGPSYVADRVAMWLSHGVRLVWVVYPVARTVAAHTAAGPTLIYTEDDELDGGDVLPEFTCPVREILDW